MNANADPPIICRRILGGYQPWTCSHCELVTDDAPPPPSKIGLVCEACRKAGLTGEPYRPLTLRPRAPRRNTDERPLLAVSMKDRTCLTEDGEYFELDELARRLAERRPGRPMTAAGCEDAAQLPPSVVICDCASDLLGWLENETDLPNSPFWQWRVDIREHTPWRPEAKSKSRFTFTRPSVAFFGWASRDKAGNKRAKGRARYYQMIDPRFFSEAVSQMFTEDGADVRALMRLGLDIRAFCQEHGLDISSSASQIAHQLLRDQRFWPQWRRKVPAADNRRIRQHLPGNHYQLFAEESKPIKSAHKFDMRSAHHTMAMRGRFPASDTFTAKGWFHGTLPEDGDRFELDAHRARRIARPGTPGYDELTAGEGLYLIALRVRPKLAADPMALPACRKAGTTYRYVFSPELRELRRLERDCQCFITGVIAAWSSTDIDEGLNEYGWWSFGQINEAGDFRRRWLKPALLAAYGSLAVRPRQHRNAYRWVSNDKAPEIGFPSRYGEIVGYERATRGEREPQTANVVWRALIESHVRLEALQYARELRDQGYDVLNIYADGLFVRDDGRMPPERPGWRYEGTRERLTFYDASHYDSAQEQKLPGIKRLLKEDSRSRLRRFERIRQEDTPCIESGSTASAR